MSLSFLGQCVTCHAKVYTNIKAHHRFHAALVGHIHEGKFYCEPECIHTT